MDKLELTKLNIRTALNDYQAHADCTSVALDRASDRFIDRFASESLKAKQPLRDLFRKSAYWNEELDAIVLDGKDTYMPRENEIRHGLDVLLNPTSCGTSDLIEIYYYLDTFFTYTCCPEFADSKFDCVRQSSVSFIKKTFPGAYAPGKKPSRILREICKQLDIIDESKGSMFQENFASLADELNGRVTNFKLVISVNPAHFLTMSNPQHDERGQTLVSCHSLNASEGYKAGCTGYALDDVSFITFTCDDPYNHDLANTRKTSRQMFAYKPYNGLLLQSRMYDTCGGTQGAQSRSETYRNIIQQEICKCENTDNSWTVMSKENGRFFDGTNYYNMAVIADGNFDGYCDWLFEKYDPHLSIQNAKKNDYESLTIGHAGMCFGCGNVCQSAIYCDHCRFEIDYCHCCGNACSNLYTAYTKDGEIIPICHDCYEDLEKEDNGFINQ